jgi:hypothetical protein
MLFLYIHKDIVKYVLNLYIDLKNEGTKIENIICKYHKINFRFYIKPHLVYKIVMEEYVEGIISVKETLIDDIVVKTESFLDNGRRNDISYYRDRVIHDSKIIHFDHWWRGNVLVTREENSNLISYNRQKDLKFLSKLRQISEHKYIYK